MVNITLSNTKDSLHSALVLLTILLYTADSHCNDIKLGYVEFPPFTYTAENGQAAGLFIETAIKVMTSAGLQWKTESLPATRLYQYLVLGKTHLFLGVKSSPIIQNKILSSNRPIGKIRLNVYWLNTELNLINKNSLKGKRIAVIRGYSYGSIGKFIRLPSNQVNVIETDSHLAGFAMLKANRVDALLNYANPAKAAIKQLSISSLSESNLLSLDCFFIFSKQHPNASSIMKKLEVTFDQLYSQSE